MSGKERHNPEINRQWGEITPELVQTAITITIGRAISEGTCEIEFCRNFMDKVERVLSVKYPPFMRPKNNPIIAFPGTSVIVSKVVELTTLQTLSSGQINNSEFNLIGGGSIELELPEGATLVLHTGQAYSTEDVFSQLPRYRYSRRIFASYTPEGEETIKIQPITGDSMKVVPLDHQLKAIEATLALLS